ncbi:MAG: hypothetical protein JXA71_19575 [Chitinispirillaceae bacterium]|nr:hypothetical protein [Chitinispirillaceae bacterium]
MSVAARILSIATHQDTGNILVTAEYTLPDGKKVTAEYHAQYTNFVGKTAQEGQEWLLNQVRYQADRYLEAYYKKNTVNDDVIATLQPAVGQVVTKDSVTWLLTNKGNLLTPYQDAASYPSDERAVKSVEIFQDGTKVVRDIAVAVEAESK